jgi:hypothetical protein
MKLCSDLLHEVVKLSRGPAKMRGERPQAKRLEKISNNIDGISTNRGLDRIYKGGLSPIP